MTLRSRYTRNILLSASLAALTAGFASPASATEFQLFPARKTSEPAQVAATSPETPTISTPEPLPAPPVVQAVPSSSGPLRVIIPNINNEQAAKPVTLVTTPNAAPTAVSAPAPSATASASQEAAPTRINNNNDLRRYSRAMYAKAQEAWNNGVMIADWSTTPIVRTMFRPNIDFAAIPASWHAAPDSGDKNVSIAQDTQAIASLAPAAGAAENINTAPPAPIVSAAPIAPSAPVAESQPDPSEPAPTLSSQSKAIAGKVSSAVTDTPPEKPLAQKVDIEHAKTTSVLSAAPAPSKSDALGIKVDQPRVKLDVNYELERAYNALIAGKSETAIQIYEDILTSQPKNKEALFGLASTYHRLGQIDIARTLYGKLLEIDPKNRDGLNNFLVLLADEAPQEALQQMEKLEAQNPGFSPIPAQMAIIYQKLGDQDKAIEKMYRALSIAPENITYRYNLAIMLDKSGKYEEAGKLYSQLLDSHAKGAPIPGDPTKIQQRLTFIRSNTTR